MLESTVVTSDPVGCSLRGPSLSRTRPVLSRRTRTSWVNAKITCVTDQCADQCPVCKPTAATTLPSSSSFWSSRLVVLRASRSGNMSTLTLAHPHPMPMLPPAVVLMINKV